MAVGEFFFYHLYCCSKSVHMYVKLAHLAAAPTCLQPCFWCESCRSHLEMFVVLQALSGQQYDEEAQQSAYKSTSGSHGQTDNSPSASFNLGPAGLSIVGSAAANHSLPVGTSANDTSKQIQQQMTASNEAFATDGSYERQQHAAASVHATALDEDFPASDAETDLSSVGLRPGRQQRVHSECLQL